MLTVNKPLPSSFYLDLRPATHSVTYIARARYPNQVTAHHNHTINGQIEHHQRMNRKFSELTFNFYEYIVIPLSPDNSIHQG